MTAIYLTLVIRKLKEHHQVKVKVEVTLRLTVSKSWCRAPSGAHDQIFITVWQLWSCFCGAPSLTRGQVCLFYMLLALASAGLSRVRVPWDSQPYFTVSDLRLLFSSPPTTCRPTVEVFDPASTGVWNTKVKVTLRLAVYRQSVRLGVWPREAHDHK
jgi:hypothetical protein